MGAQQTASQSPNPWDLSGLDPMGGQTDLLGNNVGMVGVTLVFDDEITLRMFRILELSPRRLWKAY